MSNPKCLHKIVYKRSVFKSLAQSSQFNINDDDYTRFVIFLHLPFMHSQKCAKCDKFVDILQQTYQQVDIRARSNGLRQALDDRSVAFCQQTCCKLIVRTYYPLGWCNCFLK